MGCVGTGGGANETGKGVRRRRDFEQALIGMRSMLRKRGIEGIPPAKRPQADRGRRVSQHGGKAMAEKMSKFQKEMADFEALVQALCDGATETDLAAYADLIDHNGVSGRKVELTPVLAALAFRRNRRNRDFSLTKAQAFAAVMSRGLWRFNHQGIAFYKDGELFDGQHRCAAVVISAARITVLSTPNMEREAILTVDMSSPRNAGQALQMEKITFAKEKTVLANRVMVYERQCETGKSTRFSAIEISEFVHKNERVLQDAIDIGEGSVEQLSDPPWRAIDAATCAALALRGGYPEETVTRFIKAVQQGTGESDSDATLVLHRRLAKAQEAKRTKDKLSALARDALGIRMLNNWQKGMKSVRSEWKLGKEPLPSPIFEPPMQQAAE
jgi:hypothetical protein